MEKNILVLCDDRYINKRVARAIEKHAKNHYTIAVEHCGIAFDCDSLVSDNAEWISEHYQAAKKTAFFSCFMRTEFEKTKIDCSEDDDVWLYDIIPYTNAIYFDKMTEHMDKLAGISCASKALNMAYQFEPKNIFLFGFALNESFDVRKRQLREKNINVYSVESTAPRDIFPEITIEQFESVL